MDDDIWRRRATQTLDPTRARPEPWFVGSGTGLMILVLSIVAILIVARGVTTWWLIEDAWAWWLRSGRATLSPPVPVAAPRAPPRPVGYDPAEWFMTDDYPEEAIRLGQEGRTRVTWTARADGRIVDCRIARSSGHRSLDEATCRAVRLRGHLPPRQPGTPDYSQSREIRWVLPR